MIRKNNKIYKRQAACELRKWSWISVFTKTDSFLVPIFIYQASNKSAQTFLCRAGQRKLLYKSSHFLIRLKVFSNAVY